MGFYFSKIYFYLRDRERKWGKGEEETESSSRRHAERGGPM